MFTLQPYSTYISSMFNKLIHAHSLKFRMKQNVTVTSCFYSNSDITTQEISTIKILMTKYTADIDYIPDVIIRKCVNYLLNPLSHLHKASFETGVSIIYIYYLFFQSCPIRCCVFCPVGLSSLMQHFQQVL